MVCHSKEILFILPRWSQDSLWGCFRYKFPALGILTIAAVTPSDYKISFIDENIEDIDFNTTADLIALSVMTPLAHRAYEISAQFRALRKTVVLGGIHPSVCPQEASEHADAIVVGEGEMAWLDLLIDFENGSLKKQYTHQLNSKLDEVPEARLDLLKNDSYVTKGIIQLTRGCPYDCEYCSVTAFFGRRVRNRPLNKFLAEYAGLDARFVFISDDNILSNRALAPRLFAGLKEIGKWWGSQVPITVADDPVLLKQMAESGCKSLFIGFESLSQDNLAQMDKHFVRADKHFERIKKIQDFGIGIQGSFILGYDFDTEASFDTLYEFIVKSRLEAFLLSVLTPFPGTKLANRMELEGRILTHNWSAYDMNTVVFRPQNLTPEVLQDKYNQLNKSLYSIPSIFRRAAKLRQSTIIFLPQNFGFREAWKKLLQSKDGLS